MPKFLNAYTKDDKLVLLYRDDTGKLMGRSLPAEYSFFIKSDSIDDESMRQLRSSPRVKTILQEGDYYRIVACDWQSRADYLSADTKRPGPFAKAGIPTYEGDVSSSRRYLVETAGQIARPKRCYLDLETDSRVPFTKKEEMRILCWAVVGEQGEVSSGLLDIDTDRDEGRLLQELWQALDPYDQVLAWNGDGFDFPVLKARTKLTGAWPKEVRRWLWLDHLALYKRMNTGAESGDERQSLKLNAVCHQHLGEGKDEFDGSKTWQAWAAGGVERKRLLDYNIRDTDLLRKLEQKTGYAELFQTICDVCAVFPDSYGLNPTAQVDGIMLRLGKERGIHFPTRHRWEEGTTIEKYEGAFVMKPSCEGIVKNIHVGDFASLYPSIIITWNMSPETMGPKVDPANVDGWYQVLGHKDSSFADTPHCYSPLTGQTFRTDTKGLLPEALEGLLSLRKEWSKKAADTPPGTPEWFDAMRRSTAYKVAANSFYGVMGSPFSRFFNKDLAEAVTQCGVWLIREVTIRCAEQQGMRAIYGDTDSVFIGNVDEESFRAFVDRMNKEEYPKRLLEIGCQVNRISLAYEKEFARLVMLAAKKYIGSYTHYKGKRATAESKPEVKGLEWKRGDSVLLARQLQGEVIKLLVSGAEDLTQYNDVLTRYRQKILREALTIEEIRISKSISKELDAYKVRIKKDGNAYAQPPHVRVAKTLQIRGDDVSAGTRIEYTAVPIPEGTSFAPAVDYDGDPDRYYLWEKLVYPPTQRLLEAAFPVAKWKDWLRVRPAKPRATRGKAASATVVQVETKPLGAHVIPMGVGYTVVSKTKLLVTKPEQLEPLKFKLAANVRITPTRTRIVLVCREGSTDTEVETHYLLDPSFSPEFVASLGSIGVSVLP